MLITYGINHKTAPVEVREKVSFGNNVIPLALTELKQQAGIYEAAILSTCNRTEIYCSQGEHTDPIDWLHGFHDMQSDTLQPFLYKYKDEHAVRHMLRVASGLDSMVMGEAQVLGQLKDAYQRAVHACSVGNKLNRLFQYSFRVSKEVRSNTAIGRYPVSVAFATVRLAQQIFGDLQDRTALLVGAGESIELVVKHLYEQGMRRIIISNRTLENSHRLANKYSAYAIQIADLPNHLVEADIVISSTTSPMVMIKKEMVEHAIKERKRRPMFMVDMAVPRDIDVAVGTLKDVYLYNVDDLKGIIKENLRSRQEAAKQAEGIIEVHTQEYMQWLNSLDMVATIRALRDHAGQVQSELISHGLMQIRNGADAEVVLKEIARSLTNKLIHTPTLQLKNADLENKGDLVQAIQILYGIDNPSFREDKEH